MATERQIAANRKNAAKSTGPRTAEGKAQSARNSLVHGLAAQTLLLENDEDAAAYQHSLLAWTDDLQPTSATESALIELIGRAHWRIKACAKHEFAVLAEKARNAPADHVLKQKYRASRIGRRLLYDPVPRLTQPIVDQDPFATYDLEPEYDPALMVAELKSFAEGVDWLLIRWNHLSAVLDDEEFWHYPEKLAVLRMLGLRPEDVLDNHFIGRIFNACQAVHPQPLRLKDECRIASACRPDRPNFYCRVEHLEAKTPTREEGLAFLRDVAATEIARLRVLKADGLDAIAEQDRLEAPYRARFDDGPSAALRLRYESAAARDFHRALSALMKLRSDAAKAEARSEKPATSNFTTKPCVAVNVPVSAAPNEPNSAALRVSTQPPNPLFSDSAVSLDELHQARDRRLKAAAPNEPNSASSTSPDRPSQNRISTPSGRRKRR